MYSGLTSGLSRRDSVKTVYAHRQQVYLSAINTLIDATCNGDVDAKYIEFARNRAKKLNEIRRVMR